MSTAASLAFRQNHDIRKWIRTYEDGFPPDLCAQCIDTFNREPQPLLDLAWQRYHQLSNLDTKPIYENVRAALKSIFERYKADVASGTLNYVTRLESPSISRYLPESESGNVHHFHRHADAWSMETASRQISMIAYLNDVRVGGETVFANGITIPPSRGKVLVFPSHFSFEHEGKPPVSGSKYVLVAWLHFNGVGHFYRTAEL